MSAQAQKLVGMKPNLQFAAKRLRAWWDGADFDAPSVRAAIAAKYAPAPAHSVTRHDHASQPLCDDHLIAQQIWGEGWVEPGGCDWLFEIAGRLKLPPDSNVLVFGAGLGGAPRMLTEKFGWLTAGYSSIEERRRGDVPRPYEALPQTEEGWADGGISLFAMHSAPSLDARVRQLADALKPGGRAVLVDFVATSADELRETCFPPPWLGEPERSLHYEWALSQAGMRIRRMRDETAAYMELVSTGWERWKIVYDSIVELETDEARRVARLNALSRHANMWAYRFEAMQANELNVFRFLVERVA